MDLEIDKIPIAVTVDDLSWKQQVAFEQKPQMSHFVDSIGIEISPDTLNQGEGAILREIALGLYARQIFTFGQARRIANLSVWEFQKLLGQHHIERHYNETDKAIGYRYNRSGLLGNCDSYL